MLCDKDGVRRLPLVRRLLDLPIRRKMDCIVGILAADLVAVIAAGAFGMWVLSGLRAYVGGESRWAKAQKNAVYSLERYARTRDEADYVRYQRYIQVPLEDRRARLEMMKARPDPGVVDAGFIAGGNHPQDVRDLARIFRYFRGVGDIARAVALWDRADGEVMTLQQEARNLHRIVAAGRGSSAEARASLERIDAVNDRLTSLEDAFSGNLGAAARRARSILFWLMVAGAIVLGVLSLCVSALIGGSVVSDLQVLAEAAARIASGDLRFRVGLQARDEIGRLTLAFNRMAAALDARTGELERSKEDLTAANGELQSFSSSVAHDLRAPLRNLAGFCAELEKSLPPQAGDECRDHARRIRNNVARMDAIILGLLQLSRVTRQDIRREEVDLSAVARGVAEELARAQPERRVEFSAAPGLRALGDEALLRIVLRNLLENAWKFTSKHPSASVEFGEQERGGERVFFVHDDGAGFDMAFAGSLFGPFQRLHSAHDFPGSGVGLATVKRAIERHGGRLWTEAGVERGATFYFTLPVPERLPSGAAPSQPVSAGG